MESPTNRKTGQGCCVNGTPKSSRKFYWPEPREENSPKLCGTQDRQEVFGWDESPEPIKLDPKLTASFARKRLEPKSSPLSSSKKFRPRSSRLLNCAPLEFNNDLAAIQDLSRRVLSESRNSSFDADPLLTDDLTETLIACTQQVECKNLSVTSTPSKVPITTSSRKPLYLKNMPNFNINNNTIQPHSMDLKPKNLSAFNKTEPSVSNGRDPNGNCVTLSSHISASDAINRSLSSLTVQKVMKETPALNNLDRTYTPVSSPSVNALDSTKSGTGSNSSPNSENFEKVQEFFLAEEDDVWLSQLVIPEAHPVRQKIGLTKSHSDNTLESPSPPISFRRSGSFQLDRPDAQPQMKKQKSFHIEPALSRSETQTQCSLAEIERKRLEAKLRKQSREIERKKAEAQKRLIEKQKRLLGGKIAESVKR